MDSDRARLYELRDWITKGLEIVDEVAVYTMQNEICYNKDINEVIGTVVGAQLDSASITLRSAVELIEFLVKKEYDHE